MTSHLEGRPYSQALRAAGLGAWTWDPRTDQVEFSPEWKRQLGYADDELANDLAEWRRRVHPNDLPAVERRRAAYLAAPWPDFEEEFRLRHRDGSWRWILSRAELVADGSGGVRMVGVHVDITRHKHAEGELARAHRTVEALRESQRRLEEAQRLAHVGHWERDLVGGRVSASDEFYRIVGLPPGTEPHDAGTIIRSVHPEDVARLRRTVETALAGDATGYDVEFRIVRPDGAVRFVRCIGRILRDDAGLARWTFGAMQDVTDRRATEARLHAREQEFRAIAENAPDPIIRYDRSFARTYVNPAAGALIGHPTNALVEGTIGSYTQDAPAVAIDVAMLERIRGAIATVFATGESVDVEITWPARSGRRCYITRFAPELDREGAVASVLAVGRDVTALKESERQFVALTENSPDIITRLDRAGRYVYANPALERLMGIPVRAFLGAQVGSVAPRPLAPNAAGGARAWNELVAEVIATGTPGAGEIVVPSGRGEGDRTLEVRLVPERDESGEVISLLGIGRDITDAKRAEAALRASEQRFRALVEHGLDLIAILDEHGVHQYVSPSYEEILGYASHELVGASALDFIHPEDVPMVAEVLAFDATERGPTRIPPLRVRHRDGSWRTVIGVVTDMRAEPAVRGIVANGRDVTEQLALEEQLRQSQKLDALGQLAGGVAHDFNNLLLAIQMQGSLLLLEPDVGAGVIEGVHEIMAAAERAANLTRQLLTFSRRGVAHPRDLDLGEVLGAMLKLLGRILGEDVALETRFAPALPPVHADPGMIEQILMNLAVNARDAMPDGGRLTVALDAVSLSAGELAAHPDVAPGAFVRLTVGDTGTGISREAMPHIFEPFFTTKEVGRGTGLGLSTVFGIVQLHDGWIDVESHPDAGTTFRVYLPALRRPSLRRPSAAPVPARGEPEVRGGAEVVLLVEDEEPVRRLARTALERYGYTVLEASTAEAALALWETHGASVDLLLTDIVMPGGLSGAGLAARLQASRPELPVLYTSGYPGEEVTRQLGGNPGERLLRKPYGALELARHVRRRLDRGRGD